jgi:DNA-binding winged helix-turn-helix (wHTH) protein
MVETVRGAGYRLTAKPITPVIAVPTITRSAESSA